MKSAIWIRVAATFVVLAAVNPVRAATTDEAVATIMKLFGGQDFQGKPITPSLIKGDIAMTIEHAKGDIPFDDFGLIVQSLRAKGIRHPALSTLCKEEVGYERDEVVYMCPNKNNSNMIFSFGVSGDLVGARLIIPISDLDMGDEAIDFAREGKIPLARKYFSYIFAYYIALAAQPPILATVDADREIVIYEIH